MELRPNILELQPHIGWADIESKVNSAELELELGLSLAIDSTISILICNNIPEGENTVTHNTQGKERINPNKIFEQFNKILD